MWWCFVRGQILFWHETSHDNQWQCVHYNDVEMGVKASQITNLTIVYSIVVSGADQGKHQSSASLAFVWGINSPVTGEFPTQRASDAENVSIWWRHHGYNIWHGSYLGQYHVLIGLENPPLYIPLCVTCFVFRFVCSFHHMLVSVEKRTLIFLY